MMPASSAVTALTFANYLLEALGAGGCAECSRWVAVACTVLVVAVNSWSVRLTTSMQNLFTLSKLATLVLIIGVAALFLASSP